MSYKKFNLPGLIVKNDVHSEKPHSLDHARECIEMSFDKFTPDLCSQICVSGTERLEICIYSMMECILHNLCNFLILSFYII